MSKPRPICDGFHTTSAGEFLVEVYGTDDGYVEEYAVSRLLEDGKAEEYECGSPEEEDSFQTVAQRLYNDYVESCNQLDDFE